MIWTEGVEYKKVKGGYEMLQEAFYFCGILGIEYEDENVKLEANGRLTLKIGFFWNGSNFSIDASTNMRASAFHDALYYLLDIEAIKHTWNNRRKADKVMYNIMREDGASWIRCRYFWRGLRTFGWLAC